MSIGVCVCLNLFLLYLARSLCLLPSLVREVRSLSCRPFLKQQLLQFTNSHLLTEHQISARQQETVRNQTSMFHNYKIPVEFFTADWNELLCKMCLDLTWNVMVFTEIILWILKLCHLFILYVVLLYIFQVYPANVYHFLTERKPHKCIANWLLFSAFVYLRVLALVTLNKY